MEAATVALWAFADPQCDELHGTQTSVATAKFGVRSDLDLGRVMLTVF